MTKSLVIGYKFHHLIILSESTITHKADLGVVLRCSRPEFKKNVYFIDDKNNPKDKNIFKIIFISYKKIILFVIWYK